MEQLKEARYNLKDFESRYINFCPSVCFTNKKTELATNYFNAIKETLGNLPEIKILLDMCTPGRVSDALDRAVMKILNGT